MNSADFIHRLAGLWGSNLGPALWQSTAVAILLLVLVRLGHRWPAPLRHALLLVALLKFAMPPLVSIPFGVFRLVPLAMASAPPALLGHAGITASNVNSSFAAAARIAGPASEVRVVSQPDLLSLGTLLMFIHLLGAAIVVGWAVRQQRRLSGAVHRAHPVSEGHLARQVRDLSLGLGLRRPPRLLVSSGNQPPAALGVLRPSVMVPKSLLERLDESELGMILVHELAHHRRHDLWWNWLQILLSAVWWFNPVFWMLSKRIRSLREDCCDDLALSLGASGRTGYCQTLLKAAEVVSRSAEPCAALNCTGKSRSFGRRLRRMMNGKFKPACRLSSRNLVVVFAAALAFLPGGGTVAAQLATTDCMTPLGVPCCTIQYVESQWQFSQPALKLVHKPDGGIYSVQKGALPDRLIHNESKTTAAVRQDGSKVRITEAESQSFWGGNSWQRGPSQVINLVPQKQMIQIQHDHNTISYISSPRAPFRFSKEGDPNCSTGIIHTGSDFTYAGEYIVAGVTVAKWVRGGLWSKLDEEVYLAPSLDCACLKKRTIYRNEWHLPSLIRSLEATSVLLGDPDPGLFEVPSGYEVVDPKVQGSVLITAGSSGIEPLFLTSGKSGVGPLILSSGKSIVGIVKKDNMTAGK